MTHAHKNTKPFSKASLSRFSASKIESRHYYWNTFLFSARDVFQRRTKVFTKTQQNYPGQRQCKSNCWTLFFFSSLHQSVFKPSTQFLSLPVDSRSLAVHQGLGGAPAEANKLGVTKHWIQVLQQPRFSFGVWKHKNKTVFSLLL